MKEVCGVPGFLCQFFGICHVLIITIYENKGDHVDCRNHWRISLLAIWGKVLAKTVLNRLKTIAEGVLPEAQFGFRAGRSASERIFTLQQLQEKAAEQHQPLYILFVHFTKAFDTVNLTTLWKSLKSMDTQISLLTSLKAFMMGGRHKSPWAMDQAKPFCSIWQGCILAPTLLSLYLTPVLDTIQEGLDKSVFIYTRTDWKLFNFARLRAHTKTWEMFVRGLLYADDSALVASNADDMQQIVDRFSSNMFGLKINTTKKELLYQPPSVPAGPPARNRINGEPLKTTDSFTYLGRTVTSTTLQTWK